MENGYIRVASHTRYPNRPGDAATVLNILRQFCSVDGHHFWPEEVSLGDLILPGAANTHNQITDVYLLGVAVQHGGKLATFDQHIPVMVIKGGSAAIEVIEPR